jgi:hypothetical protein
MKLCNYNYNLIYLELIKTIKINTEEIEVWDEKPLAIYNPSSTEEYNKANSQAFLYITKYPRQKVFKFSLSLFKIKNFGEIYALDSKMSRLELNFPR